MKHILSVLLLALVAAIGWRMGGELSPDAMGMAIGMLFGIMAGIPTALILLASRDHRDTMDHVRERQPQRPQVEAQPPAPPQVVNNYHNHLHLHGAQAETHASRLIETVALSSDELARMKRDQDELGKRRRRWRDRQAEVEQRHQLTVIE